MNRFIYECTEKVKETGNPTTFDLNYDDFIFEVLIEKEDGEIHFSFKQKEASEEIINNVWQYLFDKIYYPEYSDIFREE